MVGLTLVLIVAVICFTILFAMYLDMCFQSEVKMFADPKYDDRIEELEKKVKALEEK